MSKIENLRSFIKESPYGSTDWGGTRMVLLEDAYNDNVFWGGKDEPCFAARAVNADDQMDKGVYKCIWLDTPPEGMPEYWYEDPDNYIDWDKCDVVKTDEYYPDEED